jgi:hypothetical protein
VKPSALLQVLLASVALSACGGGVQAADLFIVYRSGAGPGARLTLLFNEEGGVNCNAGHVHEISNAQLLEARGITEELEKPSSEHLSLPARAGSVFSYYVRDEKGSVRFADDSASQPSVLHHLQLLVLEVAQQVCQRPR